MPRPTDLARARTAWLAGAPDAWARYLACLRQMDAAAAPVRPDRPRRAHRARRPRARG